LSLNLKAAKKQETDEIRIRSTEIVHRPETGLLYLACSNPSTRRDWLAYSQHFNISGKPQDDYIATYNIETSEIRKFELQWSSEESRARGLSVHGMDVVPSSSKSTELFFYLVNHRAPIGGDIYSTGADSVVEIFSAHLGDYVLNHIATVKHDLIKTPNDVAGHPNGKSFWFTNDHFYKTGFGKMLETYLMRYWSFVGFCEIGIGCKIAADHLFAPNGIVKSPVNDTMYVGSCGGGGIQVLERQADNTLVITDLLSTDLLPVDNLSLDRNGALFVTFHPKGADTLKRMKDLSQRAASGVYRMTLNTGESAYFGEKFKLDIVFEDDGNVIDAVTTAVSIPEKDLLIMHGIVNRRLVLCKI